MVFRVATIPLSEIPTLTLLYKSHELEPSELTRTHATPRYGDKISLIRTDITKLETDAIVNAANESLLGGGGVDGAIHRAAGPRLLRECSTLRGCDTGDAKITDAYELPCKKVIHAVGPIYYLTKPLGQHTRLLEGCYTKSLQLAVDNGCRSIAFSALSTGAYGYPSLEAAATAIAAVKAWLDADDDRAQKLDRIVFCQFLEKDESAYNRYIPQFFAPPSDAGLHNRSEESEDTKYSNASQPDEHGSQSAEDSDDTWENVTGLGDAEAEEVGQLPKLPDVPTRAPGEPGQPDAKRAKLDEEEKL